MGNELIDSRPPSRHARYGRDRDPRRAGRSQRSDDPGRGRIRSVRRQRVDECSLREAVQAANEVAPADGLFDGCAGDPNGADVIEVPTTLGTYGLTRSGQDNSNSGGDLDVSQPVRIVATGGGLATIEANAADIVPPGQEDRVVDVLPGITQTPFGSPAVAVELANLRVTGGVSGDGCGGGGIVANSATRIADSAVIGNFAETGNTCSTPNGGGIAAGAELRTERTTISGNHADGDGGGVWSVSYLPFNATIADNTASGNGGGVAAGASPPADTVSVLAFTTIARNTAAGSGGGLYSPAGSNSVLLLATLIARNGAPQGPDCLKGTGSFESQSNQARNLIGTTSGCGYVGPGPTNVDARIGSRGSYGGLTETVPLLEGSPAIDTAGACAATDQRGAARPTGVGCDIGAFEGFIPNPPAAPTGVTGPTGERAAALKRCAKIKNKRKKKTCKKRARLLPV